MEYGADLYIPNNDGKMPIYHATSLRNRDLLKWLTEENLIFDEYIDPLLQQRITIQQDRESSPTVPVTKRIIHDLQKKIQDTKRAKAAGIIQRLVRSRMRRRSEQIIAADRRKTKLIPFSDLFGCGVAVQTQVFGKLGNRLMLVVGSLSSPSSKLHRSS